MFTQNVCIDYALITHCCAGTTHFTQYYACYADLCMLRNLYAGITQALRRHYADITQSLGHLPLSDNYAVSRSHYAELCIGYAVLRSVTQFYTSLRTLQLADGLAGRVVGGRGEGEGRLHFFCENFSIF